MSRSTRRTLGGVTVQDVARAAGVSAMTVSRVMNGGTNVREDTRKAVLAAVGQLNYRPNAAARSLAAGGASQIGLLYANPSAGYLSQFLIGALETARRTGCHLVLESCEDGGAAEQEEAVRQLIDADVRGVVLPPPLSESTAVRNLLAEAGIPWAAIAMGSHEAGTLNVRIDDFGAARTITRHLIELGHREIGFIKGHFNQIASAERHRGFVAALEEAGIDPASARIEQGLFTYRSGLEAAERILAGTSAPTAIFASNDDMAAAAVGVAHRRGLQVPGDLSVVGFDDTAIATSIWPALTTIRQPVSAMAEAAITMLLRRVRERPGETETVEEEVLPYELVLRDSAGPPKR